MENNTGGGYSSPQIHGKFEFREVDNENDRRGIHQPGTTVVHIKKKEKEISKGDSSLK